MVDRPGAHLRRAAWPSPSTCSSSRSGRERAAEIMERLQAAAVQMPFQFLHRADPRQLRSFIADEHPQVIALVLAHMTPDKASLVLSGLPPELQAEVAHRIAVMDRTSPEIIRAVEANLERKLSSVLQPTEMSRVGGVDPLVNIINRVRPRHRAADRRGPRGPRRRARRRGPQPDVHVRGHRHARGPRRCSWCCARSTTAELALALKGVASAVRDKITSQPVRACRPRTSLEEIELLGAGAAGPGRGGPAGGHPHDPPARGAGPDHGPPRERR